MVGGAIYYLLFSSGGTLLWLIPYGIVIVSPLGVLKIGGAIHTGILSFYTAMCEQVTLNVLSISVLGLVGAVWTGITPFMYTERTVATIGGTLLIVTIKSRLGERLEISLR